MPHRRPRRFFLRLPALFLAFVTGCAGPSVLVVGESVRQPEPPPPTITVSVIDADNALPVSATVTVGADRTVTDDLGMVVALWPEEPTEVTAEAPGYETTTATVDVLPEEGGPVELAMEPVVLDGRVVTPEGKGLPGVTVTMAGEEVTVDEAGRFRVVRAIPGELIAVRPAWQPASIAWDGSDSSVEIELAPREIRALRVGGPIAGNPSQWQRLLELADDSAINAFVIDTKNEDGTVFHNTEVRTAHEISAVQAFYDLDRVIADMDAHGLYKITRVVTFQDNPLARARPEIAAIDETTGEPWRNNKGLRWLDPTDRDSWEYALDLAEEACRRGFDEIQFDYIRFPSDGDISTLSFDEPYTEEVRYATITEFLETAHDLLNPMGCAVAADIFAITLESSTDEGIGQMPGPLSHHVDVLSPMIYTYTYGRGWKGFDNPNDHPLEIIGAAIDNGLPKIEGTSLVRPWIQTWQLDAGEMRQVQNLVEDRGLGWMVWSANTLYDPSMFATGDPTSTTSPGTGAADDASADEPEDAGTDGDGS